MASVNSIVSLSAAVLLILINFQSTIFAYHFCDYQPLEPISLNELQQSDSLVLTYIVQKCENQTSGVELYITLLMARLNNGRTLLLNNTAHPSYPDLEGKVHLHLGFTKPEPQPVPTEFELDLHLWTAGEGVEMMAVGGPPEKTEEKTIKHIVDLLSSALSHDPGYAMTFACEQCSERLSIDEIRKIPNPISLVMPRS